MLDINSLIELLKERMGNSRSLNDTLLKSMIIASANDLISEFKQNVLIKTIQTDESKNVIPIKNLAYIFKATFNNDYIPIQKITTAINDNKLKLIVLDTQSVRLEPLQNGNLEILGSFYIDKDTDSIPLSFLFQMTLLQLATLNLFIMLDKPAEHIKVAKALSLDFKDELRTQLSRSQEKQSIMSKNIRL